MKLDILCNYWDDPRGLMRLLESPGLANITSTLHILDGQYCNHKGEAEYRQELTNEIYTNYNQRNWNGKINYSTCKGLTQVEKRNKLWRNIANTNPDFVIVLDSDEHVELNIDLFELKLKPLLMSESCCFNLEARHWDTDYLLPRLFKKYSEWRFKHIESHGSLYDLTRKNKEIINDRYNQEPVKGFKILHDKEYRSKIRKETDKKYQTVTNH